MTSKPTTYAEIAAAVDEELLKRGTPYQERPFLRSQLIAARERDAAETAKAEAARQADAAAERQRIGAVIRAGLNRGRPRQAARLALLAPVGADASAAIIQALPLDREAEASALAMPAPDACGTFGSDAARAERRRIAAILSHEVAAERFKAAVGLATTTDMPADAILSVLATMPAEPKAELAMDLEERHRQCGSFGPDFTGSTGGRSGAEQSRAMWAEAIARANREAGATSPDAGPSGANALALDQQSLDRLAAARGKR